VFMTLVTWWQCLLVMALDSDRASAEAHRPVHTMAKGGNYPQG